MNRQFDKFQLEIVIYDEIEKFRNYDHPEFSYPFERRRIDISEFDFSFEVPIEGDNYDYEYHNDQIDFRIS